ncbi:hypothetical protein N6H14_16510 [Paenibacillus sp. CC-CFT747]|nr:hypothetical protein N6H14_16510 [Paenibacillus sp. CC-CFT747]
MKQIVVFLMFAALLCWFMFAPIYKHVLIVRQAVLQKEVDYMLEVGANGSNGFIGPDAVLESRSRLEERGFRPGDIRYEISTTTGVGATDPDIPVQRGTGIRLRISYPYEHLFQIDRLAGIVPPGPDERMAAAGMKMSEYVP